MQIIHHLCDACKSEKNYDQLIQTSIEGSIYLCRDCAIKLYATGIVISCDGSLDDFGVQINLLKSLQTPQE